MKLYQPELALPKLKPIEDNEPQITALVKDFVKKVIDNKLTADMFTAEFGKEFLPRSAEDPLT